jgi:hypothetical protein
MMTILIVLNIQFIINFFSYICKLEDIIEDNESVIIFLGDDPKDRTFRRYKE